MKPTYDATSGVHPLWPPHGPYARLREVLLRHASRITVDGLLGSACTKSGLNPITLDIKGLERLVHDISPGVRMFCRPEDVPLLMLEVAALFD